jgi:hypothetical protein
MGERYEPLPARVVEDVANIRGETSRGLHRPEIGRLLADCGIADPSLGTGPSDIDCAKPSSPARSATTPAMP